MQPARGESSIKRWWREKRWFRWLVEGLVILAAFAAIRAWQTRGAAEGPAPPLALTATAQTLDGEALRLEELRGEPVVVHFWASWCGVCRAEEHNIRAVSEDHRVVAVATRSGSAAEVRAYAEENGLEMPIVNDSTGHIAGAWGVESLPTTFVLDGAGDIRHVEVGYTTELGLRARLWFAGL